LSADCREAGARHLRESAVGWIGDDFEQLLDTVASDWGDDPELGEIRADRINDGVCWRMKRWPLRPPLSTQVHREIENDLDRLCVAMGVVVAIRCVEG
jgi:hypothetical protein